MKLVVLAVLLAACAARPNLAQEVVQHASPTATCTPLYEGAGRAVIYSAVCDMPTGELAYCAIDTERAVQCTCLAHCPVEPPRPVAQQPAAPAPVAAKTPPAKD